jgi:hypothetical protein
MCYPARFHWLGLIAASALFGCERSRIVLGDGWPEDAGGADAASAGGAGGSDSSGSAGAAGAEPSPFGPPELIGALSSPGTSDDDPTLSEDLLELYFSSTRGTDLDSANVWRSVRQSIDQPWPEPEMVAELSTTSNDTSTAMSRDGLTLYVSSNRVGAHRGQNVWVYSRDSRDSAWSEPEYLAALNSDLDEVARSVALDHLTIVLSRRELGTSDYDLFVSVRDSVDSPWSEPVPLDELNTANSESSPFMLEAGLELYFSSSRAEDRGTDIYFASRATTSAPFGEAAPVTQLNSPADDADPCVSADGDYVVFATNRDDGFFELYEAFREPR